MAYPTPTSITYGRLTCDSSSQTSNAMRSDQAGTPLRAWGQWAGRSGQRLLVASRSGSAISGWRRLRCRAGKPRLATCRAAPRIDHRVFGDQIGIRLSWVKYPCQVVLGHIVVLFRLPQPDLGRLGSLPPRPGFDSIPHHHEADDDQTEPRASDCGFEGHRARRSAARFAAVA